MHTLVVALLILASELFSQSVPPSPAVLRERLEGKQASLFLQRAPWHRDLSAAQRAAARTGKLIFCHFTRSYVPCGTSIRCEKEILSAPAFQKFAKSVELFCHVTAHVDPQADRLLFQSGGSGWPHHVLMDASGRIVARHTGERSAKSFAKLLSQAQKFLAVEAATQRQIAAANARRFDAGMAVGALTLSKARKLFIAMPHDDVAVDKRRAQKLADLEIQTIASRIDRFDTKSHASAGREFYYMWLEGKRPGLRGTRRDFWGGLLAYQESRTRPNLDLYREGLAALKKQFGEERGYQRFLKSKAETFEKLKEKQKKAEAAIADAKIL